MPAGSDIPAILGGVPLRPSGPPEWPPVWPEVLEVGERVLSDGSWGRYHGPHCDALRSRLAELLAIPAEPLTGETQVPTLPEVQLCCSGTAAVELALRAARVGPGDEVILAAYDFRANIQNVLTLGATPVLVDLDRDSWQLDVSQVAAAVSPRTRAIIASHLHGAMVEMAQLMPIAESHGLTVVEDACQSTGAFLDGRRAGTHGHVGVLSFGGSKLLTAGRGGAIIARSSELAQRVRLYSERGNSAYPLSELQAALLLPQVEQLDDRNCQRLENVRLLIELLQDLQGLRPIFQTPDDGGETMPAFYKAGFQYDADSFHGLTRDRFAAAVRAEGVALDPGFRSFPQTHSRRRYRSSSDLFVAGQADEGILVLHHPVLLCDESDVRTVAQAIHRVAAASAEIAAHSGNG